MCKHCLLCRVLQAVVVIGAINAALFAVSMLANNDAELARKLAEFRDQQRDTVLDMTLPPAD